MEMSEDTNKFDSGRGSNNDNDNSSTSEEYIDQSEVINTHSIGQVRDILMLSHWSKTYISNLDTWS